MLARVLSLVPQIAPPTPDAEVEVEGSIKSGGRQLWSSLSVRGVCDGGKKNSKIEKLIPQQSLLSATAEPMALAFHTEWTGFIFHIRVI